MDAGSKVPISHTLWSPHDTVKDVADSLGVNLPDEAARNLAMDVEYRIHEILETAIKFMRHSKRKLLTTNDINYSLKMLNIEPLYGYDSSQPLHFKEALVGVGGQTLYYIDDHEIELEKLINQELPKVPRQTSFTAHWLAIEGVQPSILQNPLPSDIKSLPPNIRGATSSSLGLDLATPSFSSKKIAKDGIVNSNAIETKFTLKDSKIKPQVKHVLSKELKLYFDRVVEVLVSTDPEKEHLRNAALVSLKNDPGLHQLVPYFIQFIGEQITNQLRSIEILSTMLEVISALVDNKTIFLSPYVHALMPCILTLLLSKRIGPVVKEGDARDEESFRSQLAIREFAAILLEHIIKVYGSSYSTLKPRVTRTLLRALLDSTKPTGTHYGALLGLRNLGNEVIKLVLLGNLKMWCRQVIDEGKRTDYEKELLLGITVEILQNLKVTVGEDEENKEIAPDIIEKTRDRIGDTLTDIIIRDPNAKAIIRGIFFGELSV